MLLRGAQLVLYSVQRHLVTTHIINETFLYTLLSLRNPDERRPVAVDGPGVHQGCDGVYAHVPAHGVRRRTAIDMDMHGVEMSYVNMYLLSLGMSKSLLSIVWVAGPLSGLVMQPLVGVLSDNSTSKYGRRRPYIMAGSFIVAGGLITMAWAESIVGVFVESKVLTIILAVGAVFATDFALNAVQACCRALIVDVLPTSKQAQGNGWAGRMIAIGHLAGYFAGYIDLVEILGGRLGDTQLKSLCIIAGATLILTSSITSWAVTEKAHAAPAAAELRKRRTAVLQQVYDIFHTLAQTVWTLPDRIKMILRIQVFAWYGWFTFLFYSATWVSEVYIKYSAPLPSSNNDHSMTNSTTHVFAREDRDDKVGHMARVGSMSLMVFSTVSLLCTLVLPELLKRPMGKFTFNLTDLWFASHLVYACAALLTGFARSVQFATLVVGTFGFSWAVTTWAPFALLAEEILKLNESYNLAPDDEFDEELGLENEVGEKSGIYLGIHNVAITIPQFVSTLGSFFIFTILGESGEKEELPTDPGQGDGGRAIAWTLQVGTVTALAAAYFTRRLKYM